MSALRGDWARLGHEARAVRLPCAARWPIQGERGAFSPHKLALQGILSLKIDNLAQDLFLLAKQCARLPKAPPTREAE